MKTAEKEQLESAGYAFAQQIEQLAHEKAADGDIHSVHRLVTASISVMRMAQRIARFEMERN